MISQSEQSSNQYGFYAVPRTLEPKKKYRETVEEESKYEDESAKEQIQFEKLERSTENEKQLQRDYYVDEAPYPEFKPKERGLDCSVQIERHQLFDYDLEVQPLIEILVGRSVVSAINELQEEKEKNDRQFALDQYQKKRNAELMQTQRMEIRHNRKQDQVKRRVLQKEVYAKNKKIAIEKLIARKNAKHALLNLRNEVIGELEQQGFLRQSTYISLRVQYEGWLYEQIKEIVNQHKKIAQQSNSLLREREKEMMNEHQNNIQKENKRRKDIIDERERVRKENEERKLKKRIRKQRLKLNAERKTKHDQAAEQIQKYETAEKILKAESISNGLTKRKNTSTTIHIAGGLFNYVLTIMNVKGSLSAQQVQKILEKLLNEMESKLQVEFSMSHMEKIEELKTQMESDPIKFMTSKQNIIKQIVQKVSLDISVLEAAGISLKSELHTNILTALINIYLNCLPSQKMEVEEGVATYEVTEKDKKRETLKHKLQFVSLQTSGIEEIKKSENQVRVRFGKVEPTVPVSNEVKQDQPAKEEGEEQQPKPVDLDEWIDVYDGQNWEKKKNQERNQQLRVDQQPTSYTLNEFSNTFIVDERNLYYLGLELENLLGIQGGEEIQIYRDRLQHFFSADDKLPIYDIQLEWD